LEKKGSKYGYFVQFQPISDSYSAGHPYQFPSTARSKAVKIQSFYVALMNEMNVAASRLEVANGSR